MLMSGYRNGLIILFLLFLSSTLTAEVRAVWATAWEINSPEKIEKLVKKAENNNFNQILAEVRYRGDALYKPNRKYQKYKNPETTSYLIDKNFDPLAYLIERCSNNNIEIHAWLTTFVTTPNDITVLPRNHVYFENPEWVIKNVNEKFMMPTELEGAYFDPALPAVQSHLVNVVMDIVSNYSIAGVHLDYIRYPSPKYGISLYNPMSKKRKNHINRFVKRTFAEIKNYDKKIELTAAVIPDYDKAKIKYFQDWFDWLENEYIDKVYMMAYNKDTRLIKNKLAKIPTRIDKNKIVVGLRAWNHTQSFSADDLIEKVALTRDNEFAGLSFFSFNGLFKNSYFSLLNNSVFLEKAHLPEADFDQSIIFGYALQQDFFPIFNKKVSLLESDKYAYTDVNGFFYIDSIMTDSVTIMTEKENHVFIEHTYLKRNSDFIIKEKINIPSRLEKEEYSLRAIADNKMIVLDWKYENWFPLSIYRSEITPGNFKLLDIIIEPRRRWYDKNIELNKKYYYKIADNKQRTSNIVSTKVNLENSEIPYLDYRSTKNYIEIVINQATAVKLHLSLRDLSGNLIYEKSSWYQAGKTTEKLEIDKIDTGYEKTGIYYLYCFIEKSKKNIKKRILIN